MNIAKVVAEAGCNHGGNIETAKRMIAIAAQCGVDVVKFQKRDPNSFANMTYRHPNPRHSYGNTYGEHRAALEFDQEQHAKLLKCCLENGVGYSCSVWDCASATVISDIGASMIKIPSARNHREDIFGLLLSKCDIDIHVSLGMADSDERCEILRRGELDARHKWVYYHCTSSYPCAYENVALDEIPYLRAAAPTTASIGWSSHTRGIAIEPAAYAMGAEWIEKHFTLDREAKGTDQANSSEPKEMRRLVENLRHVYEARGYKNKLSAPEWEQRRKLR